MTISDKIPASKKSRFRKQIIMLADTLLMILSYLASWLLMMRRIPLTQYISTIIPSLVIFVVIFLLAYLVFGMYESLWRYAEAYEFYLCIVASLIAGGVFTILSYGFFQNNLFDRNIPLTVHVLSAFFAGISTLYMRVFYRAYRASRKTNMRSATGQQKVLLVGAGNTGSAILQDIQRDMNSKYFIVCAVDDDPDKQNRRIQRVKVSGTTEDIPRLVEKHGIHTIIIAIPSASEDDRRRVMNICAQTKCQLKKVPDLYKFVTDARSVVSQINDVQVEDLLGREVVDIGAQLGYIHDRVVLVTGGGGSIGSELCRQIAAQSPKLLLIVDIYENGAYELQQELIRRYGSALNIVVQIASVRDSRKVAWLFDRYRPEIVFHAAAHKHVPLMETAPVEAIKNNICGTWNVAKCADEYGAKRFVMISTDKAVNPTNIMGATKRVCEMIVQAMDEMSRTEFVAVRFGNVLGSSGSVIPLFKEQIAAGGPVTVTHPDIIRYFMTIPEAANLVLKAGELAAGGEIFVLDMGEPVRIMDLAQNLIRLSGYEPGQDIKIEITGLRPGEKLYEEMLMAEEGLQKTANEKIFIGAPIPISPSYLFELLGELRESAYKNDADGCIKMLAGLVPTFNHAENAVSAAYAQETAAAVGK